MRNQRKTSASARTSTRGRIQKSTSKAAVPPRNGKAPLSRTQKSGESRANGRGASQRAVHSRRKIRAALTPALSQGEREIGAAPPRPQGKESPAAAAAVPRSDDPLRACCNSTPLPPEEFTSVYDSDMRGDVAFVSSFSYNRPEAEPESRTVHCYDTFGRLLSMEGDACGNVTTYSYSRDDLRPKKRASRASPRRARAKEVRKPDTNKTRSPRPSPGGREGSSRRSAVSTKAADGTRSGPATVRTSRRSVMSTSTSRREPPKKPRRASSCARTNNPPDLATPSPWPSPGERGEHNAKDRLRLAALRRRFHQRRGDRHAGRAGVPAIAGVSVRSVLQLAPRFVGRGARRGNPRPARHALSGPQRRDRQVSRTDDFYGIRFADEN